MDSDIRALVSMAQLYFDAAYEMDADGFAALFHPASSVSSVARIGDDVSVTVTPIEAWLAAVRTMKAPRQLGLERRDEILSIDVVKQLAMVKLTLQILPRGFTDLLSCVKVSGAWRIVQKLTLVEAQPRAT
jgi:hypothetical protein